ncbi:MAG: oligoendopeptidase F, partial [Rhizobiales bacterium]|nr:oligoendopeptidase F [Hyphomicrobiales bacterium]
MTSSPSPTHSAPLAAVPAGSQLGVLPEWNLADLYPGMQSPELAGDLLAAAEGAVAFERKWKGTLATLAREGGLAEAVREFEILDERMGRLVSYAGLVYSGDTTDPVGAKFYGD